MRRSQWRRFQYGTHPLTDMAFLTQNYLTPFRKTEFVSERPSVTATGVKITMLSDLTAPP